ncbi:uncharacterized protein [Physcomitrium patens]|uniref:Thioredoxin domain-containing protein n=1 Tax=Physcomitrium patens TaxID=3218 RepID=A0A2K1IWU0_PHYPA|nr:thioredoxin-like [Physcomitrium patens]XP_024403301.1 thioredoxin-like [Physcomitrium patens]XP_024403302.1 thioredoxin-like [Physcomitrium patens]PNR33743.1 hypothetical protein PHYPA_023559 [Physcomitrium patens]|eukprot:XP_024403300.1 thioredoxin-like [Physcomitrella patens]
MATRALRVLRRPLYSSLCRLRTLSFMPPSSSTIFSSRELPPSWVLNQRQSLHKLTTQSTSFASSLRHFASSPGGTSAVIEVSTADEYKRLLNEAKEDKKLAVVYFTAKWCGPCRHISPVVNTLSQEFGDVKFLKVDLDEPELQKTIEMAGIAAVPSFQFHLKGNMVSGFSGADSNKLKDTVQELLEEAKA